MVSAICGASDSRRGLPTGLCEAILSGSRNAKFGQLEVMPAGPLRGQPMSHANPAPPLVTLDPYQSVIFPEAPSSESWAVANFVARSGFSIAYVPKVAPESVSIVKERETDVNYHLMIRLVFPKEHPVRFWTQNMDGLVADAREVRDVLIEFGSHSTEADANRPFNVWHGIALRYAMQSRMGTTYFKQRRILRDRRSVTEYPARLTEEQKLGLLERFFERSEEVQRGELYHTIVKNCATEVKHLMCTLGGPKENFFTWAWRELVSWTPDGVLKILRRRGYDIDVQERPIVVAPEDQL
jgi:hypothetical protein